MRSPHDGELMSNFRPINGDTRFLLPPSVDEWLPRRHLARFVVEVIDIHPAGDHTLYIGQVEYFEARDEKPLLFYAGKYHQLPGREPKTFPHPENEFSLFSIGSFDPPVK